MKKLSKTVVIVTIASLMTSPLLAYETRTKHENNRSAQSEKVQAKQQSKATKKAAKNQRHKYSKGQRFSQDRVVVVNDWEKRGLRRPNTGEVYVIDGEDLYLAAAASMIIKELID